MLMNAAQYWSNHMAAEVVGDYRDLYGGVSVPSGVLTVVWGPFQGGRYVHKALTLLNQGALTLSGAVVQVNPDPVGYEAGMTSTNPTVPLPSPSAAMWETIDASTFQSLATGAVKTAFFSTQVAKWWRVAALNDRSASLNVSGYGYLNTL